MSVTAPGEQAVVGSRTAEILAGLVADSGAGSMADRLVVACTESVGVSGVGLMLMTAAGPAGVLAASDGAASTMEELQFSLGEGPCVEASRVGHPVLHPDLAGTGPGRYPVFSAGALQAGIRAIFAFPLRLGAIRVGVLDLYRDQRGILSQGQLAEALAFVDAATAILLQMHTGLSGPENRDQLTDVLEPRAVVHQATGYISVQAGVGLGAALALLRARAFASGRPIVAVAQDVVDARLMFGRDDR